MMPPNTFAARSGAQMNRQPVPMNAAPQPIATPVAAPIASPLIGASPVAMNSAMPANNARFLQGGRPPMQNFQMPNPYQVNAQPQPGQIEPPQNVAAMRMGMM